MCINFHNITASPWFPCLTSLIGTFVGGLIALISTWIITSRTHKHNFEMLEKRQDMEAEAITNALITELYALKAIFEHEFMPKICNEETYLNYEYPLGTDYFSIFNSNTSNIGKIKNDELRTCIINLYVTAKFFLDSIVTNNNALADYEKYYDEIHSITYAETDPFTVPKDKENLDFAFERLEKSKEENLLPACKKLSDLFECLDKILAEKRPN